ncbi:RICIN domain-containing protein [Kitasatospora griseola]|uniref:RICIN domain-containing protein n=1 Tax=Kitasatospora griseola TaxID=2064 RepID=UPI003825045E
MRSFKISALLAALVAVPGTVASIPESAVEATAPLAVETFAYPGAAKILAEQGIVLKASDGSMRLTDCTAPGDVLRVSSAVDPKEICFRVSGASGYLSMEIPRVYAIWNGGDRAVKATVSANGTTSSVDLIKNQWKEVGFGDDKGPETVLLDLTATDGTPAVIPAPEFPAVGAVNVGPVGRAGSRGCTATLVDPLWVLTSASCFTDNPSALASGAPATKSAFTAGGRTLDIVELVPRTDRDVAMARLASPISNVAPVKLATTAPANGAGVKVAGYGRTTSWGTGNGPRTTAQNVTAVSSTGLDVAPGNGAATVCAGDAGAPLLTAAGEIAGVVSRAWQGGCLGTDTAETRTSAYSGRTDGLGTWATQQTSRSYEILNPASGRCLNLSGAGPWANSTPIIAWDCTLGANNEKFQITADGKLRNPISNRCLNVSGAGPVWDNGTPIILFDCNSQPNEKFEWTADGQLRNPASGRCLNVSGAGPVWNNNTPIILFDCNSQPNEKFRPVADNEIPNPVGRLKNQASGRCLNISGGGPTWPNSTPIILFDCNGENNELFQLTADGLLHIYNYSSNRCLNISGAGPVWNNGTPIILFDCNSDPNEKFEWTADGQLRNPASNRCLNVSGAGPVWNNGTPIILFDCNSDPNEKFQLIAVQV